MFQVFVADLYDKLSADMALLKEIMRDMSYEIPSDCTFEDFNAKIRTDDRTRVIDDMNLRLAYQKVWRGLHNNMADVHVVRKCFASWRCLGKIMDKHGRPLNSRYIRNRQRRLRLPCFFFNIRGRYRRKATNR